MARMILAVVILAIAACVVLAEPGSQFGYGNEHGTDYGGYGGKASVDVNRNPYGSSYKVVQSHPALHYGGYSHSGYGHQGYRPGYGSYGHLGHK